MIIETLANKYTSMYKTRSFASGDFVAVALLPHPSRTPLVPLDLNGYSATYAHVFVFSEQRAANRSLLLHLTAALNLLLRGQLNSDGVLLCFLLVSFWALLDLWLNRLGFRRCVYTTLP